MLDVRTVRLRITYQDNEKLGTSRWYCTPDQAHISTNMKSATMPPGTSGVPVMVSAVGQPGSFAFRDTDTPVPRIARNSRELSGVPRTHVVTFFSPKMTAAMCNENIIGNELTACTRLVRPRDKAHLIDEVARGVLTKITLRTVFTSHSLRLAAWSLFLSAPSRLPGAARSCPGPLDLIRSLHFLLFGSLSALPASSSFRLVALHFSLWALLVGRLSALAADSSFRLVALHLLFAPLLMVLLPSWFRLVALSSSVLSCFCTKPYILAHALLCFVDALQDYIVVAGASFLFRCFVCPCFVSKFLHEINAPLNDIASALVVESFPSWRIPLFSYFPCFVFVLLSFHLLIAVPRSFYRSPVCRNSCKQPTF